MLDEHYTIYIIYLYIFYISAYELMYTHVREC